MDKTVKFQLGDLFLKIVLKAYGMQPEVKDIPNSILTEVDGSVKIIYKDITEEQNKVIEDLFYYIKKDIDQVNEFFENQLYLLDSIPFNNIKFKKGYTYQKERYLTIIDNAEKFGINNIKDYFINEKSPKLKDPENLYKKENLKVLFFIHHHFNEDLAKHYYYNMRFGTDEQIKEIFDIENQVIKTTEDHLMKLLIVSKMVKGGGNK